MVDLPENADRGVPEKPAPEVASMYGLTPKVEAAIRDCFASQQWRRLRMLMDPLHPADKADLLERISIDEIQILVSQYGNEFDPEILPYLDEDVREDVVEMLEPDVLAASLPELDSDDVVTIAEELEPEELDDALAALPARDRVLVEQSLSYPEDSAGRLMQREMVVVPPFWTVGQTIDYLRSTELDNDDFYLIMVTDTAGHPVGEVRLNKLLCAQRPRRISEIMDTDIRSLPVTMDQEEVALLFRRYGMVTTGVVDNEGRLAGIITLDDIIDVIDEEAEEDLMALAGVSDASIRTSVLETLRGRTPWLFVNLLTAIAASIVIGFFENTIEKIVALAVLMPIVASMGGNAGTQTITVAVRAIAMREFSPKLAVTFGLRELYVGVINGVLFAGVTALLSYIWFGQADIALLLAVAMFINLIVAALFGTLIPLLLVKSGVDPAVASSVFITTITDVIGFLVFLGLAALYLL
ncbi:MAG: magnesium transporter [Alphaproteobacteria bacterium]|nr:magnesium transporter [Alphaproteobacteria bacterium]MBL6777599.1 magnesium transporter [Alphaproteobacteria bacterium]